MIKFNTPQNGHELARIRPYFNEQNQLDKERT
jgi:hypothetical protein